MTVDWPGMPRLAVVVLATALGTLGAAGAAAPSDPGRAPSMPTVRFQDNGDGTVTDLESKLMWMRCSTGQRWQTGRCAGAAGVLAWADAQAHAEQINLDGSAFFNDWRVPSIRELATITEITAVSGNGNGNGGGNVADTRSRPRTNLAVFPGTVSAAYWSATQRPGEASQERAFAMGFGAEGVVVALKVEKHHLRLVRTGP